MSEKLGRSGDNQPTEPVENITDGTYIEPGANLASDEQVNLAEEFIRNAGVNPSEVNYSVHISSDYERTEEGELVLDEEGNPKPVLNPTSGWVKSRKAAIDSPLNTPDFEKLLVRRAPSVIIRPSRARRPERRAGEQETLVFGDAQVPFQDPRAMELAHIAIQTLKPDNVVFVGDMIDLTSQSKYQQRPEWVGGTQAAIDQLHAQYARIRCESPNTKLHVVHGNHEQRLDNYLVNNAMEVLHLRRANMSKGLAVLSLQYLLRYDDLEINAIDGYPNGELWLEENLKFMHGTNAKKGGVNAAKYLYEEPVTTIYGHAHRQELAYKTIPLRGGASYTIGAGSPGALCKIDGSVPGFNHTVSAQGEVVLKAEDWQQGMMLVHHEGLHHEITPVRFTERGMRINGKLYNVDDPQFDLKDGQSALQFAV